MNRAPSTNSGRCRKLGQFGGRTAPGGGAGVAEKAAAAASDGHPALVTSVRPVRAGWVIDWKLELHAPPLSVAVIDQLYTAYCRSPSRSVHPSATLPVMVTVVEIAMRMFGTTSVAVAPVTTGAGVFFCVHHNLVPPHGQGPAKLIVMFIVLEFDKQFTCAKVALAVIVPGAHFAVNTPAETGELLTMTGTVQPTAPAVAAFRSRARRSNERLPGVDSTARAYLRNALRRIRCDTRQMRDVHVRRGAATWRTAPGYLTVASIDGRSVEIGGPAVAIWNALPADGDESVAIGALTDRLATEFYLTPSVAERHVVEVLDALETIGCVVRRA